MAWKVGAGFDITKIINSNGDQFPFTEAGLISAIADLPNVTSPGGGALETGKGGKIFLPSGRVSLASRLEILPGSVLVFEGMGAGTYQKSRLPGTQWHGGTVIYGQSTTGIIRANVNGAGFPQSSVWFHGIQFRQKNPASPQAQVAVNMDGAFILDMRNVDVCSDIVTSITAKNMASGLQHTPGENHSWTSIYNLGVGGFYDTGAYFNCSHLRLYNLRAVYIGDSPAAGIGLKWVMGQHNFIYNYQCADITRYGIAALDISTFDGYVFSPHFEQVGVGATVNLSAYLMWVFHPVLDIGGAWAADMNNPAKVRVKYLTYRTDLTKLTENCGIGTMLNGTNTVDISHNLIQIPRNVFITANHAELEDAVVSAKANLTFTVSRAGNVTADRTFDWQGWV